MSGILKEEKENDEQEQREKALNPLKLLDGTRWDSGVY